MTVLVVFEIEQADIDNDGDIDLIVREFREKIYKIKSNHWKTL